MSRFILFAAILSSLFGTVSAQIQGSPIADDHRHKCPDKTILDNPGVSKAGRAAYYALERAERFETGNVGFAGTPSTYIASLRTIMREPLAGDILEYLFEQATPAGKLYALSGLYSTEPLYFGRAVEMLKTSGETVQVLNGCLMSSEPVAKIIESDAANVAIIEPGETMKEFWATNVGSFELDIVHGGYPATFAEFADTKAQNRK